MRKVGTTISPRNVFNDTFILLLMLKILRNIEHIMLSLTKEMPDEILAELPSCQG